MSLFNLLTEFILHPWFIVSLTFWIIVIILVFTLKNRKGAYSLMFPLLIMFKTKRLNHFIRRISKKAPRFWRIFWNIGIFVSFGFTLFGFYYFFVNLIQLFVAPSPGNAITPLIPGVTVSLPTLFYILLPLLFIVTTHEFAHGISANIDGVEVKSTGVMGVGLFYLVGFGAFVEVDERELRSTKFQRNTRLRIAAGGTFVNAITAGVAIILIINYAFLASPHYTQVTQVYSVLPDYEGGLNPDNLEPSDAIIAIKNSEDPDSNFLSLDLNQGISLTSILSNTTRVKFSIGDNLTFATYNPITDLYSRKNVTVGPRYDIGIRYKYLANGTGFKITYNYTSESETNIIITHVNGTAINKTNDITLELFLLNFNLKALNLTSNLGKSYILNVEVVGVRVGILSTYYWLHRSDIGKLFTSNWPDFWLRELVWLFIISFSITLFNMMPLPIFDGDRFLKELVDWRFGVDYASKRKRRDRLIYKGEDTECKLTEYRVENVESVKIFLKDAPKGDPNSEIILGRDNYELVDKIGDGFKDTVVVNLPDTIRIGKNSVFEVSYEYWYDEKRKIKSVIINTIRIIALGLIIGNFILSFLKFGFGFFWL
ncbi:MAG: site-2 protease family protein [Candidatus Hermodarchaeota archaeon]